MNKKSCPPLPHFHTKTPVLIPSLYFLITDDIVMTPTKKVKGKCLTIERKKKNLVRDEDAHFKAAGKNAGMVVNKEISDASKF